MKKLAILAALTLLAPQITAANSPCNPDTDGYLQRCIKSMEQQLRQLQREKQTQQAEIQAQQAEIQALKMRESLKKGLVAYYPFEGSAHDASGYGNHGGVYGATLTVDRFGRSNSAYSFDGDNDCILASDSDSLDIQNSISLLAWVKTDGSHQEGAGMIVAKHHSHNARSYALYDADDAYHKWGWNGKGPRLDLCEPNDVCHDTSDKRINTGWNFLTGTYDKSSGRMKFYINAVLVSQNTVGWLDLMQTSVPLSIGCYLLSSNGSKRRMFFNGRIDDVRIYNRAITPQEIRSLYYQR